MSGKDVAILDCDREVFEVLNTEHSYIIGKERCRTIKNKIYGSTIGKDEELFIQVKDNTEFEVIKSKKL